MMSSNRNQHRIEFVEIHFKDCLKIKSKNISKISSNSIQKHHSIGTIRYRTSHRCYKLIIQYKDIISVTMNTFNNILFAGHV